MADFFGTDHISFTIGSDEFNGVTLDQNGVVRPVVTRSYTSFSQAAEENGQSRIYMGIHWSFDKVQGIDLGDEIADYVFGHFLRRSGDRGMNLAVDRDGMTVFAEQATPAGPTLAVVMAGSGQGQAAGGHFNMRGGQPANVVVMVDASHMGQTAQGNPAGNLSAAFGMPGILRLHRPSDNTDDSTS
jgi:hypothetical protein